MPPEEVLDNIAQRPKQQESTEMTIDSSPGSPHHERPTLRIPRIDLRSVQLDGRSKTHKSTAHVSE